MSSDITTKRSSTAALHKGSMGSSPQHDDRAVQSGVSNVTTTKLKPLATSSTYEITANIQLPNLGPSNVAVKTLIQLDLTKIPKKGLISGRFLGRVMRVYDGDTMTVAISLDGSEYWAHQIRLYGCDAPEAKGTTKTAAIRAKEEVLRFIGADGAIGKKNGREMNTWFQSNPALITIEFMSGTLGKVDKYGRDLAKIWVDGTTSDLTTHLITHGYAYAYQGGTKDQSQYEDE